MTEEKTRDDILNEEIEAEHAEAERRNNTTVDMKLLQMKNQKCLKKI